MSSIQAIVKHSHIVTITFTGIPSPELRKSMMDNGYKFNNGHWYKSQSEGQIAAEDKVAEIIAA